MRSLQTVPWNAVLGVIAMTCAEQSLEYVTKEMIEAGFAVLKASGIADDYLGADKLLVVEIYLAMQKIWICQKAETESS